MNLPHRESLWIRFACFVSDRDVLVVEEEPPSNPDLHLLRLNFPEFVEVPVVVLAMRILRNHLDHHTLSLVLIFLWRDVDVKVIAGWIR